MHCIPWEKYEKRKGVDDSFVSYHLGSPLEFWLKNIAFSPILFRSLSFFLSLCIPLRFDSLAGGQNIVTPFLFNLYSFFGELNLYFSFFKISLMYFMIWPLTASVHQKRNTWLQLLRSAPSWKCHEEEMATLSIVKRRPLGADIEPTKNLFLCSSFCSLRET